MPYEYNFIQVLENIFRQVGFKVAFRDKLILIQHFQVARKI